MKKTVRASALKPRLEDALLDAAELLFGRHGPDGVSLRQIALAAGSSNHFAVQYHFRDKQTLLRAVVERRLRSLEVNRGRLLEALVRQGRQEDTRALLAVLLRPIADERSTDGRASYAAFLLGLRVFSELQAHWSEAAESGPMARHLTGLIQASLKGMPEDLFLERLYAAITVFLASVVDCDRLAGKDPAWGGGEDHLQRAIDFGAAGLTAPV